MKKIFIFLAIVVIIVSILLVRYSSYKLEYNTTIQENSEYEQYTDKEIYGLDVVTIINKAIDKNRKNNIEQSDERIFIENDSNSIKVEVGLKYEDEIRQVPMETIYINGIDQFMILYRDITFKCSKIEYHESTGKIKYMLFEQT